MGGEIPSESLLITIQKKGEEKTLKFITSLVCGKIFQVLFLFLGCKYYSFLIFELIRKQAQSWEDGEKLTC